MRPVVSTPLKIKALREIVFKKSLGLDLGQSFLSWKLAGNKAPETLTQTKGKGRGQACASFRYLLCIPLASCYHSQSFPLRPAIIPQASPALCPIPWACLGLGLSLRIAGDMRAFKAALCFALGFRLQAIKKPRFLGQGLGFRFGAV
jgi:hypothetical protein